MTGSPSVPCRSSWPRRWAACFPWLVIVVAGLLLVYPARRLWPSAVQWGKPAPPLPPAATPLVEVAESDHFCLFAPAGYLSAGELAAFLAEAEARRARLVAFLEIDPEAAQATVRLNPGPGAPRACAPCVIDLYGLEEGQNNLLHELTHCLVQAEEPLLEEGLAVLMEEKFGWGISSVTGGRTLNGDLYAQQRAGATLLPLAPHRYDRGVWHHGESALTHLLYLEAGAFVKYLIDRYGKEAVLAVFATSSLRPLGDTLDNLEGAWRAQLGTGHVVQACTLFAGGMAALLLAHVAQGGSPLWCLGAAAGHVAFYLWALYLAYPLLLPALMGVAVVVVCVAPRISRGRGLGLGLLLGMGVLGWYLLVPLVG